MMTRITDILRYVLYRIVWLLSLLPYVLSALVPQRNGQWVFGSGGGTRFEENSKYLYLYAVDDDRINPVWISKNADVVKSLQEEGYPATYAYSRRGIVALLRAEMAIVSFDVHKDLPWYLLGRTCVVQLWHGIPLKNIGWESQWFRSPLDRIFYDRIFWNFCRLIVPSEHTKPIFGRSFSTDPDRIRPLGYPRDDVLFRDVPGSNVEVRSEIPELLESTNDFVVGYFPTFRHYDFDEIPKFDLDFKQLNKEFEQMGCTMVVKHHPNMSLSLSEDRNNILVADKSLDPYPIFSHIDLLITDYSSIYFDYLLTDNPIIFYVPDRDSYLESTGFLLEYDEVTPGPSITTQEELLSCIEQFKRGADPYEMDRTELKMKYFDHVDGDASERICDYLCQE